MAVQAPDSLEINLTPLLDLVLQLIMFFMACVNFVSEQYSRNVWLPVAQSAQEIRPELADERIVINVELAWEVLRDASGQVVIDPVRNQPARKLREPRTYRIVVLGEAMIQFTDRDRNVGMFHAQRKLRDLAGDMRLLLRERPYRGRLLPTDPEAPIPVPVVFRVDEEIPGGMVFELMSQCRAEGFLDVRIDGLMPAGGS
ncbi:MAG TPA: biopolymer transporter ExbD [Gemmatales bacterium]|nr:biopolymer transporter ExbD [Gemmatales bacterium]HMP59037.1 biopolymer transporter ExbD [Gemmatales bacterium]